MTNYEMTEWFRLDEFYPENVGTYPIRLRPRCNPEESVGSSWGLTRYWDGSVWRITFQGEISNIMMHRGKYQWRGFTTQQFFPRKEPSDEDYSFSNVDD